MRKIPFGLGIAGGAAVTVLLRRRAPINLEDKHILITGGSRGLGLVLAREFLSRGARVTITARDSKELAAAEEQLRKISSERRGGAGEQRNTARYRGGSGPS